MLKYGQEHSKDAKVLLHDDPSRHQERAKSFVSIKVLHERRECNLEAYLLAKHGCILKFGKYFWSIVPPVMLNVDLYIDVKNKSPNLFKKKGHTDMHSTGRKVGQATQPAPPHYSTEKHART